jgi:hypothetical protein
MSFEKNRPKCIPGVDVMITIFCDFSQFSAKKLAFFSKTNVMIIFFQNLASFRVKNANFFANFLAKIFKKNHNIGPRSPCSGSWLSVTLPHTLSSSSSPIFLF